MKIIAREALYVKSANIKPKVRRRLEEKYTFRFYNESACRSCEYLLERHCDICDNCNAFLGVVQLASQVKRGSTSYMKFPAGAEQKVLKDLAKQSDSIQINYKQTKPEDVPFKRPVRFKYKLLKDYQRPAYKSLIEKRKGVLKSAPRTGKTVMTTAAICKVGGKTLILAAQRTWLEGFYETFCGSKTQKRFTDATGAGVDTAAIREWVKAGRPHRTIGFAKTLEDFHKLDVCLCTYQTFLSEAGQALLAKVASMFSVLVVDEVHTSNADKFAHTVASINSYFKWGLSGTPQRKDKREVIVEHLFGPIIHETEVKQLRPTVALTTTKFVYTAKRPRWDQIVSSLDNNPKRLRLIAETAIRDAKAGHMILIPLTRVKAVKALTMAINRIAGKQIAAEFHGGVSKDTRIATIQKCRDYKIRVLVGFIKMISTGINIPRASCLYEVTLSSNIPNAEQRFKRILTPYDDKPPPMVRYFLDNMKVRRNCMKNEYWNCLVPTCKPNVNNKVKAQLLQYFRGDTGFGKVEL